MKERLVFFKVTNRSGSCIAALLFVALLLPFTTNAHNLRPGDKHMINRSARTIRGTVRDQGGEAMPGVSVSIKGSTRGTLTDVTGIYTLEVLPGDSLLVFSFIGYISIEMPIGDRSEISVNMETQNNALDEIVVVGYGSQSKRNLTGAVGSIKGAEMKTAAVADASGLLQGRLSGVTVQNGGGAPGQAPSVVIRGTGTFGNDQPLYVIDGMIASSMAFLNPNDIESVEVLKDASAAAIYGSRASNGVVLVTTKSGGSGEVQIGLNLKYGFQSPTKRLKLMNARQYADWNNMAHDNDGLARAPINDTEFNPNVDTDWEKLSLGNAPMSDYNLSISGGNRSAKYFISGQYFDQKGIAVDSWFKRYNMRANSSFTKGRFQFTQALSLSRSISNPNTYIGRETGPLPTMPVYDETKLGGFAGLEPAFAGVARVVNWYGLAFLNDNKFTVDQMLGNIGLQYELCDGLKYKLNAGIDYSMQRNYSFTPKFFMSSSQEAFQEKSTLSDAFIQSLTTLIENTLSYSKSFDKHNLDLLAGYTSQNGVQPSLSAAAADFPSSDLRVIDAAINRGLDTRGSLQEFVLRSFLGRLNYNYKSKYLITATIRRDGSSKFLYPKNTFATFPSFSVGWRLSDEPFFPVNTAINDLKLRASYGTLGSQNIGNYLTSPTFNLSTDYFFGGGRQPGIAVIQYVNPNLKWESAKTVDVGFDMKMFNNSLDISADYFDKYSFDILAILPIPSYGGGGSSLTKNAASIRNRGFELTVTYFGNKTSKGFNYNITGMLNTVKNEVIELGTGVNPITGGGYSQAGGVATRTDIGQPVGSFYGYQVLGIYQTKEEAAADSISNAGPGDFKFSKEKTWLGNPFPKINYGLNFSATWKNFDLGVFFQGVGGNKLFNAKGKYQHITDYGSNKSVAALSAWTPQNPNTNIPRATQLDPANNKRPSSFYIENGSYLRLKTLMIGYSLPKTWLERAKMTHARVYLSGQNLLTFTKYSGYDPEVGRNSNGGNIPGNIGGLLNNGVDQTAYPNARIVNVGIDLNF